MPIDADKPPIQVEFGQHAYADAHLWANARILTTYLKAEFAEITSYSSEAAVELAKLAIELPTPLFLMAFYSKQIEIALATVRNSKYPVAERKALFGRVENFIKILQTKANILAVSASMYVDYFMSEQYKGEKPTSIMHAIARVVEQIQPEPPSQWPPTTDKEKRAMVELDKSLMTRGSDALASAMNSVCRQANALTLDLCELRGMQPYTCVISLQREGIRSGHIITVIFEGDNKQDPTFIDGHNNIVSRGFDELSETWLKSGWKITKCEASRLKSVSIGNEENSQSAVKPRASQWDEVKYV